jgi:hypothetical protein
MHYFKDICADLSIIMFIIIHMFAYKQKLTKNACAHSLTVNKFVYNFIRY